MRAIDFFCGGGGMTNGLIQAGINVVAGIDLDSAAKETYEHNNPGASFINANLNKLATSWLADNLSIKRKDDEMIFVGCSPCQFYSIIRSSKDKSRATKDLLLQFLRFVEHYLPGYVMVENVPGIMTNKETILNDFLDKLALLGYGTPENGRCAYDIVNMKDYGVPQTRKRFSLIATRLDKIVRLPEKSNSPVSVRETIGDTTYFPEISAGYRDENRARCHSARSLSELNLRRIRAVKHDGGTRMAFKDDPDLQLRCYIGKDNSFRDVYGRLRWDAPSSTITTKFLSITNGRFGHPEQDRGLSVREGASLQTFPFNYEFKTDSISTAARLIGNAVPPEYARRLGKAVMEED